MTARATFVTPTYVRDLQTFTLLRESMERCEIDIPHVAVVHHEDIPLFRKVPFQHKLTLVSTRDALPAIIECRRTMPHYRRRHPYHWIRPRHLHGWGVQQVVKLNAPAYIDSPGILCLDSESFFVAKVEEADFFDESGKLHLYENDCEFTVETIYWLAQSMLAFNVPLRFDPYQYIHTPTPMHRDVLLGMQAELTRIHHRPWYEVFVNKCLTEYNTYGVYARFVNELKHVSPVKPPFTLVCWSTEQLAKHQPTLHDRIREGKVRVMCINSGSGLGVDEYRSLVEGAWAAGTR